MAYRCIIDGRFDEARFRAQDQMNRFGENGKARFILGLSHHKQKRYDLARPQFERAIELEPGYTATYNFYGYCLFYLGELDGARKAFMTHLSHMPDWADTYFGLGLIDLEEDRLDDAQMRFMKAIELNEAELAKKPAKQDLKADLAKAHTRLAEVHLWRDDLEKAKAELVTATQLWPDAYEAWAKLHRVLKRLGEDEAAEAALKNHDAALQRVRPRSAVPATPTPSPSPAPATPERPS